MEGRRSHPEPQLRVEFAMFIVAQPELRLPD